MSLFFNEDINTLFVGGTSVSAVYLGSELVWPTGLPIGTTFDFNYTGTVQSIELPKGRYKLLCWGALGGTSSGSSNGIGSKGGYSEGFLTLNETKTLYIFVGGMGSSSGNGGWNGGGGSTGSTSYSSGGTYGRSYPACGGGATDIALVTSDMGYSNKVNSRSSESLLSRIIVAGGGAGGSYRYTETETTGTTWSLINSSKTTHDFTDADGKYVYNFNPAEVPDGSYYKISVSITTDLAVITWTGRDSNGNAIIYQSVSNNTSFIPQTNSSVSYYLINVRYSVYKSSGPTVSFYKLTTTTSTSTNSSYSNQSQQGGGTSGIGSLPGTQSSAGGGSYPGGFGYGGSLKVSGYRYASGGAGGGWYGGGTGYSDSSASTYIKYTGGGSGFVNTAANASYRPANYTGLQLDSGTTYAGNTSFPSTIHPVIGNGTETGHSGNGFARIIRCDDDGNVIGPGSPVITLSTVWTTLSGTWNTSSNSSAIDGLMYTSVSPGTNGSTRIRCTFSGVTSITFGISSNGESCCDYLTCGTLDSTCTRSSYNTRLTSGSSTVTYTCDAGTHYVEFCYSKDGSVNTSPDNATVYIKSYQ